MKIYIVKGCRGEYDDYFKFNDGAYSDKNEAITRLRYLEEENRRKCLENGEAINNADYDYKWWEPTIYNIEIMEVK